MVHIKRLCSLLFLILTPKVFATISIVDKGVLPLIKDSVAIQFFVDIENEDRKETCEIHSKMKKCCLTDSNEEDCDVVDIVSETQDAVEPKGRNTLTHILPMIYQHDLNGYCEILLTYRCPRKQKKLKLKIPFDTTLQRKRSLSLVRDYIGDHKPEACETVDQNPLNECSPVDCDLKYLGRRPFYDANIKRCVKAPVCLGDTDNELPDIVCDPKVNMCKDLSSPLSFRDIYSMSTGLGTVVRTNKPDVVKVKLKSNCTTISQNLLLLRDLMYGKLCPHDKNEEVDYKDNCRSAVVSIVLCIVSVSALLLSLACCVKTTVWVYGQWVNGNIKNFIKKCKCKRTKSEHQKCQNGEDVRHSLLREVVVKDIPLELRETIISICDRAEKEVHKKKRYRKSDVGSQISLQRDGIDSPATISSDDEVNDTRSLIK